MPTLTQDVGHVLFDLMKANVWPGAEQWRDMANKIAPTLVGGSKKHGGPDLGPTRARKAWAEMGIDGRGVSITTFCLHLHFDKQTTWIFTRS